MWPGPNKQGDAGCGEWEHAGQLACSWGILRKALCRGRACAGAQPFDAVPQLCPPTHTSCGYGGGRSTLPVPQTERRPRHHSRAVSTLLLAVQGHEVRAPQLAVAHHVVREGFGGHAGCGGGAASGGHQGQTGHTVSEPE